MIAQVTAASLVSENKILCHPASVDSIPSSAGREDHVSMGATSALKAARVVRNARMASPSRCPRRGAGPRRAAPAQARQAASRAAHACLRSRVPTLDGDRRARAGHPTRGRAGRERVLLARVGAAVGALA
jgi:histidine ammonia-lyase